MLRVTDSLCLQGNINLEDGIGIGNKFAFVIDGATGLGNNSMQSDHSDAELFTQSLVKQLTVLLNSNDPIEKILKSTIDEIYPTFSDYYRTLKHKYERPSAGICILRILGNELECSRLGDCIYTLKMKDRSYITDDLTHLNDLDDEALRLMVELRDSKTQQDRKGELMDILRKNRKLMNDKNGYWILDLSGEGIDHISTVRYPLKDVDGFSVYSDGMVQAYDTLDMVDSYERLYELSREIGLKELGRRIFEIQDSDPDCVRYPRFKIHDDTSGIIGSVDCQ